jgi:hypothetical protein
MSAPKHTGGGLSSDPSARFVYCFEDALRLIRTAADQWATGDPEKPLTEEVLCSVLDVFEKQKFLRRPID